MTDPNVPTAEELARIGLPAGAGDPTDPEQRSASPVGWSGPSKGTPPALAFQPGDLMPSDLRSLDLPSVARTLAAYAVNLARGHTLTEDEFRHLAVLGASQGMVCGPDDPAAWFTRQTALRSALSIAADEMARDRLPRRPWWRRVTFWRSK